MRGNNEKEHKYSISLIEPIFDPDTMLYNRFDIIYEESVYMVQVIDEEVASSWKIPVYIIKSEAHIGVWLSDIPSKAVEIASKYIMAYFHVRIVRYKNYSYELGCAKASNQWTISLPSSTEDLWNRITNKHKYNLKREKQIIEKNIGEIQFLEYSEYNLPNELIEAFFNFKKTLMGTDYGMSPKEFIKNFHITNAYEMISSGKCMAMIFSCEYGNSVYLDNLSYNPAYAKYSCGKVLYAHYLECLVEKGKRILFLGDGQQEYKRHFGATESIVWGGEIYKNIFLKYLYTNTIILKSYIFLMRLFFDKGNK